MKVDEIELNLDCVYLIQCARPNGAVYVFKVENLRDGVYMKVVS